MFREVLTKSGRRLLKAIKKLSTRSRAVRKSQQISHYDSDSPVRTLNNWTQSYPDPDSASLSWSLPSLDTKSVDTYLTYVTEQSIDECTSMCCYCQEHDENQRNENRENEMII